VFNLNSSTTFRAVTNNAWNVTSIDPSPNGAHVIRGYDLASFGPNVSVPGFPFETWSHSTSSNRSSLGLGINSSVISSFIGANVAPSPEVGLFYGSRSIQYPSDGEMVVGGYNSGLVNGSFSNFSLGSSYLDQPCLLQVLLKDVVVTTSNGTRTSIMPDPGARVPACVNPVENAFQFTPAMYKVWANLTQHPSNPPPDGSKNFTDQTYPLANEALINELIITLEGGYQVTIPHFELVTLERGVNAQGLYDVINSSRIQAAVTSNGGRFSFPILGGVFLSQNYLKVDYSRKVFGLAHASMGSVENSTVVSTCVENDVQPVQPSQPPQSPSSSSSSTSLPDGSLGTGAIAGIAVGSVAGFLLVIALLFFLWRRSQSKSSSATILTYNPSAPAWGLPRHWTELEDNNKEIAELPSPPPKEPILNISPISQFSNC
jgi:hypothetical protein